LDIEELLNPMREREIITTNVSDEEIFESVCERQQGEEMMEINGGGGYRKGDHEHAEPSRCSSSITHPAVVCGKS